MRRLSCRQTSNQISKKFDCSGWNLTEKVTQPHIKHYPVIPILHKVIQIWIFCSVYFCFYISVIFSTLESLAFLITITNKNVSKGLFLCKYWLATNYSEHLFNFQHVYMESPPEFTWKGTKLFFADLKSFFFSSRSLPYHSILYSTLFV